MKQKEVKEVPDFDLSDEEEEKKKIAAEDPNANIEQKEDPASGHTYCRCVHAPSVSSSVATTLPSS